MVYEEFIYMAIDLGQLGTSIKSSISSSISTVGTTIDSLIRTPIKQITGASDLSAIRLGGISVGAIPFYAVPAEPNFGTIKDLRVKIKVPAEYLKDMSLGSIRDENGNGEEILSNGGIVFPFTPTISYENSAEYSEIRPMHTNYNFWAYRASKIGPISITGKFTVQNANEAQIYLSTVHLLRSLTKMKFGNNVINAGAPPPVCVLMAYGDPMVNNIPVVVQSFKMDLPNDIDYFYLGDGYHLFSNAMVPVSSSISLTLIPMYSRREISEFNTDSFIQGKLNGKGYL